MTHSGVQWCTSKKAKAMVWLGRSRIASMGYDSSASVVDAGMRTFPSSTKRGNTEYDDGARVEDEVRHVAHTSQQQHFEVKITPHTEKSAATRRGKRKKGGVVAPICSTVQTPATSSRCNTNNNGEAGTFNFSMPRVHVPDPDREKKQKIIQKPRNQLGMNQDDTYQLPEQSVGFKQMRVVIDLNKGKAMEQPISVKKDNEEEQINVGVVAPHGKRNKALAHPQSATRVHSKQKFAKRLLKDVDEEPGATGSNSSSRVRPYSAETNSWQTMDGVYKLQTENKRQKQASIAQKAERKMKKKMRASSAPRAASQSKKMRGRKTMSCVAMELRDLEKELNEDNPITPSKPEPFTPAPSAAVTVTQDPTCRFCVRGRLGGGMLIYLTELLKQEKKWQTESSSSVTNHCVVSSASSNGHDKSAIPRELLKCNLLLSAADGDARTYELLADPRLKGVRFNHFEKNNEITTKRGLVASLPELVWTCGESPCTFFPRCYSLNSGADVAAFTRDYYLTAASGVIKLYASHGAACATYLQEHCAFTGAGANRILRLALNVCERRLEELLGHLSNALPVDERDWELLSEANQCLAQAFVLPFADDASATQTSSCALFCSAVNNNEHTSMQKKAVQIEKALNERDPQWLMDGCHNVWIIKPSDKSNGAGIVLHDRLNKIVTDAQRMSGARIVQKYVENPLLGHELQKLDLRVWVLVTSWDPLKVWIFHPFYCRMSGSKYTMDRKSLTDKAVHLCNYSAQAHDSYLTEDDLHTHLGHETEQQRRKFSEQVEHTCILAIRAGQNKVVHRQGSFEMYGVDLIVDRAGKENTVWLLEVNLSPGIKNHDMQFTEIAKNMCRGLYSVVFEDGNDVPESNRAGWKMVFSEEANKRPQIVADIPTAAAAFNDATYVAVAAASKQLLGPGRTCAHKFLLRGRTMPENDIKSIDVMFRQQNAAETLTRFAKDASARWPAVKKQRHNAVIALQCLTRLLAAQKQLQQQRSSRACARVQGAWRCKVARITVATLRGEKMRRDAVQIQRTWLRYQLRSRRAILAHALNHWACYFATRLCATKLLQAAVRTWQLRSTLYARVETTQRKTTAAVAIQCVVRHKLAIRTAEKQRRVVAERKEKLAALRRKAEKRLRAAATIRRVWHERAWRRNMATFMLQRAWREHKQRTAAAKMLERVWKRHMELTKLAQQSLRWALNRWHKNEMCHQFLLLAKAEHKRRLKMKIHKTQEQLVQYKPELELQAAVRCPKHKEKRREAKLKENRQRRLVPTHLSREEISLSELMRKHKLKRPDLPPPLFDL